MNIEKNPKGSPQYINKLNKRKILNIIREHGQVSRAEIAKISGISAPTVTRIVEDLINEEKLINEIGAGPSSGGRRPTLLEFSGLDNFVIGIDLGTTHIYGVLANFNAETIAEIKMPTELNQGYKDILERTADIICELQQNPKVKGKKIFGIGLAVAGLINRKKNLVEYSPDMHWNKVDILSILSERCDLPIIFDNVTRVMALGELWYGIGKKVKNFVVVNVGYGIGAGIVIRGKPFFGNEGIAGEFGHMILEKDSDYICECGNKGCLEALASGRAIAFSARNKIEEGRESILKEKCGGDLSLISAEMVANAAKEGDVLAKEVFDFAAEYLGIGIAGLINLLCPRAVVIGGGVSQAGDLLFNKVNDIIHTRALKTIREDIVLKSTTFGQDAAVKGAIALILNEVLHLKF